MMNFNPNQQPPMFPAIAELEDKVHPVMKFVFGACGGVGGFFFGLQQQALPLALFIGVGVVIGLLLVPLVVNSLSLLVAVLIVAAAALATFWLLNNDAAIRQQHEMRQHVPHSVERMEL